MTPAVSTPPEPIAELAKRFVVHLTILATELHLESGPHPAGLRALVKFTDELVDGVAPKLALAAGGEADKATRASVEDLRITLQQLLRQVRSPLLEAMLLGDEEKARSVVRAAADRCLALRDEVLSRFGIARPETDGRAAILLVDLVRYTDRARRLTRAYEHVSGHHAALDAVARLNDEIAHHIRTAFSHAQPGTDAADHVLRRTDDGAILRFETVADALRFAAALHGKAATSGGDAGIGTSFVYRIGVAYGPVRRVRPAGNPPLEEWIGTPFIDAARMKSIAPPGGTAVTEGAWAVLPPELSVAGDGSRPLWGFQAWSGIIKDREYRARVWAPLAG